jgi:hypothetical protein
VSLLGMKVIETSMLPGDMVVMCRNGEVMHRFIWTANALADQEREIASLRAQLAASEAARQRAEGECRRLDAVNVDAILRAQSAERALGEAREAFARERAEHINDIACGERRLLKVEAQRDAAREALREIAEYAERVESESSLRGDDPSANLIRTGRGYTAEDEAKWRGHIEAAGMRWISKRARALAASSPPSTVEGSDKLAANSASSPGAATEAATVVRKAGRCSLCGSQRLPLNREGTRFGACSLVPGDDGKGGCPDPLHDYEREPSFPGSANGSNEGGV